MFEYHCEMLPLEIRGNKNVRAEGAAQAYQDVLNDAGDAGWEFVATDTILYSEEPGCFGKSPPPQQIKIAIFKRPKR